MTIEQLSEKRKNLRQQLIDNNAMNGFKELLTVLYSDKVHFIYELLQNAEDAGASEVQFILDPDRLVFEHNGNQLFTIEDVESITNIGSSTKIDDPTSIGEFGIGFKSVFAYTATPEIESGDFHFRIHDMFVPDTEGLSIGALGEKKTRFIFPFDNPEKSAEKACDEIKTKLSQLNGNTLLFLNNIRRIEYRLPNSKNGFLERTEAAGGENRIKISVVNPGKAKPDYIHYLRFTKDVNVRDESGNAKHCQIAVAFDMNESKDGKWKIIPLNPGQVFIYFPAVKETSNLRFHIHAPFPSTVARDSVRECHASDELRDCLSELIAESMHAIRDQGLLDVRFLAVLPNDTDNLSSFYQPIRDQLVEEFNKTKLTPMRQGGHSPASECYRGARKLSNLINDEDLAILLKIDQPIPLWIANPQRLNSSPEDNFLSMLNITEWTVEDLVEELDTYENIVEWLKDKKYGWHQRLYVFLGDFLSDASTDPDSAVQERMNRLFNIRIVRCEDKDYRIGSECRFFDYGKSDSQTDWARIKGFHYVAKGVYSSGRSENQQKKARRFLEDIGVLEWDIVAEVIEHILPKYDDISSTISLTEYNNDFSKIVKAYKTDSQKEKDQLYEALMTTPFIRTKDSRVNNRIFLKPDQLRFGVDDVLWSENSTGTYSPVSVTKTVHQFLHRLDIPKWNIVDEVVETILTKYKHEPPRVSIKEHVSDFKNIMRAYETSDEYQKMQLKDELEVTHFILAENSETDFPFYLKPKHLYFATDNLRMYFEGSSLVFWVETWNMDKEYLIEYGYDVNKYHAELWNDFVDLNGRPMAGAFVNLDKYPRAARALFEDLGVVDGVRIRKKEKNLQGYVTIISRYGQHHRGLDGFDSNIKVDGLEYALERPTPDISAFIWNHIARPNVDYIRGVVEKSTTQNYGNSSFENVLSDSFGDLLLTNAWLPDVDGNMHKPSEITLEELPEEFVRDQRLADQLRMKRDEEAELAEKSGVSIEVIRDLKENPELCEKIKEWKAEKAKREQAPPLESEESESKRASYQIDYPDEIEKSFNKSGKTEVQPYIIDNGRVNNPERRREKIAEDHRDRLNGEPNANDRRKKTYRTILEGPDPQVREYLSQMYGGKCQICDNTFPERDGEPFFVATYIVERQKSRAVDTSANALCLCADHFAKFKHGTIEAEDVSAQIEDFQTESEGGDCKPILDVKLCGEKCEIRFKEKHLLDLQELIKVSKDD